jgi:hypothetical protein
LENDYEDFSIKSVVDDELRLRAALIEAAYKKLNIDPKNRSKEALERIGSYFDEESDRLSEPHTESAIQRLIARGDFPSDLYDIKIIPNIRIFFGVKFEREKGLIERTIRRPHREQHFGPSPVEDQPSLISLFAREFKTPFVFKNFTMLVAGQRGKDHTLHIHQAWRLYQPPLNLLGALSLVQMLERFADVYGAEISLDGQRGHFFLTAHGLIPKKIEIQKPGKKGFQEVTVTRFAQDDPVTGATHAALVMAIDLVQYRATLENRDSEDIS